MAVAATLPPAETLVLVGSPRRWAALQCIVTCATGRCMLGNLGGHIDLTTSYFFCPAPLFSLFLLLGHCSLSIARRATMPFPKRDRKVEAAKRMIREAFEDLERAISPTDSNDFGSATLESVQKAALDIENQLAARSSLRNMRRLMPLFSGLQHYSSAVEVLCNGTPYLPWIWAPIKLILKVSRGHCDMLLLVPLSDLLYSEGHVLTCHCTPYRLRRTTWKHSSRSSKHTRELASR